MMCLVGAAKTTHINLDGHVYRRSWRSRAQQQVQLFISQTPAAAAAAVAVTDRQHDKFSSEKSSAGSTACMRPHKNNWSIRPSILVCMAK